LRIAIQAALTDRRYRDAAQEIQTAIQSTDPLDRAADIIENSLNLAQYQSPFHSTS